MKRLINKVQDFQKKAAQVQQAIHNAPAQAAKLREAVTISAGELHQLRSDVQTELSGLRTNSEEHLLQAMREINDATNAFSEAGYQLAGMDLDLAIVQRLAVRLEKVSETHNSILRSLVSKETRPAIKSILSGLVQAEQIADRVHLTEVSFHGVIVHIGPAPTVRMCWRSEIDEPQIEIIPPASLVSQPESSFFERRSTPPSVVSPAPAAPEPAPIAKTELPKPITSSPWGASALDRFKKMPDLSKYK